LLDQCDLPVVLFTRSGQLGDDAQTAHPRFCLSRCGVHIHNRKQAWQRDRDFADGGLVSQTT